MKILITGATGFLGGATAAALLEAGHAAALQLLVRADSPSAGLGRIKDSLRRFEVPDAQLDQLTLQQIIPGDLGDVAAFADHHSLDEITHVLNCAAVASFGDHPGIWPINVDATLEFAQRMARAPKLQRFLHVGTAMVCGPNRQSPIHETWDFPPADQHLVRYTASKAEAEKRMRGLANFPLVVARPSIVVGHSRLGCSPSSSIFWVFRMVQDLGCFLLAVDDRIDVIPVDYCAQALTHLLLGKNLKSDLYHISAGVSSGVSFREIDAVMAQARGIPPVSGSYRQITQDDIPKLIPEFQKRLGIKNRRLLAAATKLYGGFASLNYLFDNTRLCNEGVLPPPTFTSYVAKCVRTTEGIPLLEQMYSDFK